MIEQIITSAVYDSGLPDAKVISFEYNLYEDGDKEKYIGGYSIKGGKVHVHQSDCMAFCSPEGADYAKTCSMAVDAGTCIKSDFQLTAVDTSRTEVVAGITKHTEYYKV